MALSTRWLEKLKIPQYKIQGKSKALAAVFHSSQIEGNSHAPPSAPQYAFSLGMDTHQFSIIDLTVM